MGAQEEISSNGKPESANDDGMRSVGARIKYVRETILGLKQVELAAALARLSGGTLTRGAIGNWETKGQISAENVTLLSRLSGVSSDWILSGTGKIPEKTGRGMELLNESGVSRSSTDLSAAPRTVLTEPTIPVLGRVAAGQWAEVDPVASIDFPREYLPVEESRYPKQHTYGLRVEGDSLDKVAREGEVLVCLDVEHSGYQFREEDLVIVRRTRMQGGDHEVTAKRVKRVNGQMVLMPESTNPKWQTPIELTPDGVTEDCVVTVIARVLWIYRPV